METEIISDYNRSLCKAMLDYILLDPEERKRLKIHNFPAEYPAIVIRAPIPWHNTFVISSHVLHHRLFIVNPILLSLRDLWEFQ
jgi:dynein heavy chain